jgi:hypothetical protein
MNAAAQRTPGGPTLPVVRRAGTVGLAALGLFAACLLAAPAVAASGSSAPGKGDLQPLWRGYPLDPGAGQVDRTSGGTSGRERTHAGPTPAEPAGGGSSVLVPLAAAGGSVLLAALAALLVLRGRWTPPSLMKGARMSRFLNKLSQREAARTASGEIREVIAIKPETDEEEAVQPEPEAAEAAVAPEATEAPAESAVNDASGVGKHVQTVIKAAEDAAARLIGEARAQAHEVRETAEREASSQVEAASATAARLTEEAERAHAEALAAAAQARAAAEEEAAARRAEAEEEAETVRAEAERDASSFGREAAERYEELLTDTALAEDRLRRLVDGLRDVADRLDDLLEAEDDEEPTDRPGAEHDATLEEALEPTMPKAGAGAP